MALDSSLFLYSFIIIFMSFDLFGAPLPVEKQSQKTAPRQDKGKNVIEKPSQASCGLPPYDYGSEPRPVQSLVKEPSGLVTMWH